MSCLVVRKEACRSSELPGGASPNGRSVEVMLIGICEGERLTVEWHPHHNFLPIRSLAYPVLKINRRLNNYEFIFSIL